MLGIFDSGLGGLTVVKEILRLMPEADFVYLADTARVPYGNRSPETIIAYTKEAVQFLLQENIDLLVVACHTASSHAVPLLRPSLAIPVLGMIEMGIEEIVSDPSLKNIAILGTTSTVQSRVYQHYFQTHHPQIHVEALGCPLLVPLIEEGLSQHSIAENVVRYYLQKIDRQNLDAVLLACTHYPLIAPILQRVLGPKVRILEPAERMAKQACLLMQTPRAEQRFYVTDAPEQFQRQASLFLKGNIQVQRAYTESNVNFLKTQIAGNL